MAVGGSLRLSHELGVVEKYGRINQSKSLAAKCRSHLPNFYHCLHSLRQDVWSFHVKHQIYKPIYHVPHHCNSFICRASAIPSSANGIPLLKSMTLALTRSYNALQGSPIILQLVPAVGIIVFALVGLGPLIHQSRRVFLHGNDSNWKRSRTYYVFTSYLQPLLLWTGATLICRVLDPIVLPSQANHAVKQRLLNFIRSLSTVLVFAYCISGLIQQAQKFLMDMNDSGDARNMGFEFTGKAVYTAVWVAAFSLFMELLGFSTQKWITAGGLGTVLLTLAGREIFTNFLSSIMIHATQPFVVNEWIQTTIEGYEVSGTVERVGWWSPTIIRGDDREAIHIPNHKFTVSVVRNHSQKTHWRIKTHLAISHLDANKINNIVADMRKVLSKNPQVEQQRLHRRVFLDNINPENQALLILVSCFVKTSHFEEYLCVKEAVLLDLLRVVSHHRARLATPIRTVQKIYGDANLENIPFAETIFSHAGTASNHPYILVDPSSTINVEDKAKPHPTSRSHEEHTMPTSKGMQNTIDKQQQQQKANSVDDHRSKSGKTDTPAAPSARTPSKPQLDGLDSVGVGSKACSDKPQISEAVDNSLATKGRPAFEDNIVLGVALEGSKRTLPIEDGMGPVASTNTMAAAWNGNKTPPLKDKKEAQPGASSGDPRDQIR